MLLQVRPLGSLAAGTFVSDMLSSGIVEPTALVRNSRCASDKGFLFCGLSCVLGQLFTFSLPDLVLLVEADLHRAVVEIVRAVCWLSWAAKLGARKSSTGNLEKESAGFMLRSLRGVISFVCHESGLFCCQELRRLDDGDGFQSDAETRLAQIMLRN